MFLESFGHNKLRSKNVVVRNIQQNPNKLKETKHAEINTEQREMSLFSRQN